MDNSAGNGTKAGQVTLCFSSLLLWNLASEMKTNQAAIMLRSSQNFLRTVGACDVIEKRRVLSDGYGIILAFDKEQH